MNEVQKKTDKQILSIKGTIENNICTFLIFFVGNTKNRSIMIDPFVSSF